MSNPMAPHPSLRRLLLAMAAVLFGIGLGCTSSESHWQEDVGDMTASDASADTSTGGDTTTTTADTSEPGDTTSIDTLDDTSQQDASDTSSMDTTADMADSSDMSDGDTVEPGPRLVVEDQVLSAADQIVIDEVEIEAAGWVAIFDTALGTGSDAIIGTHFLDGTELVTTDLVVTLDRALADGESLEARLYVDAGQSGVFEPDTDDPIAIGADGSSVSETFTVSWPQLTFEDQTLELSTVVEVASASLAGDGWLVLHGHSSMGGGQPDTSVVLAAVAVGGASETALRVVVGEPLTDGSQVWAALYHESGGDPAAYEPGVDLPVSDLATAEPLVDDALISVVDGAGAIRITVTAADETTGMTLSAEPAELLTLDTTPWPTLELRATWRYEIVNPFATEHPFEIIDSKSDTVLLSQSAMGTAEGTRVIDWREDGDRVTFTVAGDLPGMADAYRSATGTATGSGEVVVSTP